MLVIWSVVILDAAWRGFIHCLCVQLQKGEPSEADEDDSPDVLQPAQLYAPKSLVLVSRLDHAEVFRVRWTHTKLHMTESKTSQASTVRFLLF